MDFFPSFQIRLTRPINMEGGRDCFSGFQMLQENHVTHQVPVFSVSVLHPFRSEADNLRSIGGF